MNWIAHLKQKARAIKTESYALRLAYRDRRTPWYAKALILITLGYLLSPIDLIPDFIPVLGFVDDLIIIPVLITFSIKLLPKEVLLDSRERARLTVQTKSGKAWWFAILIVLFWLFMAYLVMRHFQLVNLLRPYFDQG